MGYVHYELVAENYLRIFSVDLDELLAVTIPPFVRGGRISVLGSGGAKHTLYDLYWNTPHDKSRWRKT